MCHKNYASEKPPRSLSSSHEKPLEQGWIFSAGLVTLEVVFKQYKEVSYPRLCTKPSSKH